MEKKNKKPVTPGTKKKGAQQAPSSKAKPAKAGKPAKPAKPKPPWDHIANKPIIYRMVATILTLVSPEFQHKRLCDGMVFNLGDACVFTCAYCYVETVILKLVTKLINAFNRKYGTHFGFQDFVIRRKDAINVLRKQLLRSDGTPRYKDEGDTRVVYTSTLVDPAATLDLLRETAAACVLILENTNWQIRILSKSVLLKLLIEKEMIPKEYHRRLILGFSIGTLDDKVAAAIEPGTSSPSLRIKALHWLQDHGIRVFGMICPNLPQKDYAKFSKEVCAAIRVDRCEHVWGEVMNVRGKSRKNTLKALEEAGLAEEVELFKSVFFGPAKNATGKGLKAAINARKDAWESYARETFEAHCVNIPPGKLRFLQYADKNTIDWWAAQRSRGAVPIGKTAIERMLLAGGLSAPMEPLPELTEEDIRIRDGLEEAINRGLRSSLESAMAIHRYRTYKDGLLWKKEHFSFQDYCDKKFRYAKANGYRQKNVGGFIAAYAESKGVVANDQGIIPIESMLDSLPASAGQIRHFLESVPDEHQVTCWNKILETHNPRDLTGTLVGQLSEQFLKDNNLKSRRKEKKSDAGEKKKPDAQETAIRLLERLRLALSELPNHLAYDQYLTGMSWLIEKSKAKVATPGGGACGCSAASTAIDVESTVVDINGADDSDQQDAPADSETEPGEPDGNDAD